MEHWRSDDVIGVPVFRVLALMFKKSCSSKREAFTEKSDRNL